MKNQFAHKEEPQYWTRRYEELREGAAGGLIGSDCRGMSVLIRRGLVAWMRTWRDPFCAAGASAYGAESHPIPAGRSWQREATLLRHGITLDTLHNARYAGAFCFGTTRSWKDPKGRWHCVTLPREQWAILIKDAHPGYIDWEEFEENQRRLVDNRQGRALHREGGPPREGPALLQGLVICGKCGRAMTLRYHQRGGRLSPNYLCQSQFVQECRTICQNIPGGVVDDALSGLIVESLIPLALEVALHVQEQLQDRLAEADRLRGQHVERAAYEAEQARIRYMCVDPNNRLVADILEALWNEKLRQLEEAREQYEKQRQSDHCTLTQEQKAQILALAEDFPRLWKDAGTSDRDRKRMARLIFEDVTLIRDRTLITAHVRFKGGATRVLSVPMPPTASQMRKTKAQIITQIDHLLEECSNSQIAAELNKKGWRSSGNRPFSAEIIRQLCCNYKLPGRAERLRARGLLSARKIAQLIDSKPNLVDYWRERGLLNGVRFNDKNEYLYKRPAPEVVQHIKRRTRLKKNLS